MISNKKICSLLHPRKKAPRVVLYKPLLFPILLATLSLSCSGQQPADVNLKKVCRLPAELRESSGIVVSGPNLIWSHNDANNSAHLYAFDTLGSLRRTLAITGFSNTDWEDLATDDDGNIYIGDLGNNSNARTDLRILRIPDPNNIAGDEVTPEAIQIFYSDQSSYPPPSTEKNFDVEAIVWREGYLYLFTKDRSIPFTGISKMYKVPAIPGVYQLAPYDQIFLGNDTEKARVTSAAYNRHNGMLCLLTHDRILCFSNYPSDHFFEGELTTFYLNPLPGQNEAIDFCGTSKIYMTEEGSSGAAGFLYEFHFPSASGTENPAGPKKNITLRVLPASGQLVITPRPTASHSCEISSIDGRIWKTFPNTDGNINISGLHSGIYLLRLLDAQGKLMGLAKFLVP